MNIIIKKYKNLLIALVVVLLVFIIGDTIYFDTRSTPQRISESTRSMTVSPVEPASTLSTLEKALDAQCNAWKNSEAQALYDQQPASQRKLSIRGIQNSFPACR